LNNELIGKYLQELRLKNNLTQGNVSNICNVSHQAVSHWEKGKSLPDIESLKALSEFYKISINDILDCKTSSDKIHIQKHIDNVYRSNDLLKFSFLIITFVNIACILPVVSNVIFVISYIVFDIIGIIIFIRVLLSIFNKNKKVLET